MKSTLKVTTAFLLFLVLLLIPGCRKGDKDLEFVLAEQYGLAYAPLQVVKEKAFLEDLLPGIKIRWVQLGNTAAIREGMLSGSVDAGFMGIPPFLIGRDRGMDWRIVTGLSITPLGLVVNKDRLKTLSDFTSQDRIALPQPGSIQHILLAKACETQLGDPRALDNHLVTLNHPDGMTALLAGAGVSAHFTSLPYLDQELKQKGMRLLLTGEEAMGEVFSFIVGVAPSALKEKHPGHVKALAEAVRLGIDFINKNPREAAKFLAPLYGLSVEETERYIMYPGQRYTTEVLGIGEFLEFMIRSGYITGKELFEDDLFW